MGTYQIPHDKRGSNYILQTRSLSKFCCKHPNCFLKFSLSPNKDIVCNIIAFFVSYIQSFLEKSDEVAINS